MNKMFKYIRSKLIKLTDLTKGIKSIFKIPINSKQNFQITLLVLILLAVIYPYLIKTYNGYLENKRMAKIREEQFEEAKRERIIKEKQTTLLKKYDVNSLEYNDYLDVPDVYGIPDEVYEYLETKKDIINNEHKFTCENPPRIEDYNAPASSYFPQTDVYFRQFDIDQFMRDCKRLKERKSTYNNFEKDAGNIKKLIDENIYSNDFNIQKMVERLNADYSKYLILKQDLKE
jgi:hypothetical protein